jgi:hypothetical protein
MMLLVIDYCDDKVAYFIIYPTGISLDIILIPKTINGMEINWRLKPRCIFTTLFLMTDINKGLSIL